MTSKAHDRVRMLKIFDIYVSGEIMGDDLVLTRYGKTIHYNVDNFMLFDKNFLVDDILRRFRELDLNGHSKSKEERREIAEKLFYDKVASEQEARKTGMSLYNGYHAQVRKQTSNSHNIDVSKRKEAIRKNLEESGLV